MPRHVHLPPVLPYVGPQPLEKKEKARRKPGILAEATGESADAKPEAGAEAPAAAAPPQTHNPRPLSGSGGLLGVLLDAQEAAQPAAPPTRRPAADDDI
jgi:hypothetical protein